MDRRRCLELLNLKPDASQEAIHKAYHDLVKVWHPDRFGQDPALAEKAQEMLKAINEAHSTLLKTPSYQEPPRYPSARPPVHKTGMFHGSFLWFLILAIGCLILFGIGRKAFHGSFYNSSPDKNLQAIA